jgi:hypothetical protein
MDWEKASFFMGLVVLALQAWNLYISSQLKLWVHQTFVTKTDFLDTLHMWSSSNERKGHCERHS